MSVFLIQFDDFDYVNANKIEMIGIDEFKALWFYTRNSSTRYVNEKYKDCFLKNLTKIDQNKQDIESNLRG